MCPHALSLRRPPRVPRAAQAVPGLLRDLTTAGVELATFEVKRPTLDDVFLTLTGRSLREAEAATERPDRTEPATSGAPA